MHLAPTESTADGLAQTCWEGGGNVFAGQAEAHALSGLGIEIRFGEHVAIAAPPGWGNSKPLSTVHQWQGACPLAQTGREAFNRR